MVIVELFFALLLISVLVMRSCSCGASDSMVNDEMTSRRPLGDPLGVSDNFDEDPFGDIETPFSSTLIERYRDDDGESKQAYRYATAATSWAPKAHYFDPIKHKIQKPVDLWNLHIKS